jgi:hypothetical protein
VLVGFIEGFFLIHALLVMPRIIQGVVGLREDAPRPFVFAFLFVLLCILSVLLLFALPVVVIPPLRQMNGGVPKHHYGSVWAVSFAVGMVSYTLVWPRKRG